MKVYDDSNLPDDPRDDGFVDAHGPGGRIARVREEDGPFVVVDPHDGKRTERPEGGFLVWEDGAWRAVTRNEFMDDGWDVDLGSSPSTLEVEPEGDQSGTPSTEQS